MSSRGHISKGAHDSARPPTEFVRAHYRSAWIGAVLRREERAYNGRRIGDLLTVVLVADCHGKPLQRRIMMSIDASWTTPVTFDAAGVNPDWWVIS